MKRKRTPTKGAEKMKIRGGEGEPELQSLRDYRLPKRFAPYAVQAINFCNGVVPGIRSFVAAAGH